MPSFSPPLLILLLLYVSLASSRLVTAFDPDGDNGIDLSLSSEDLSALGLPQSGSKPGEVDASLKDLGLTQKELRELTKPEQVDDDLDIMNRRDQRNIDAAPPPGMVAKPPQVKITSREEDDFDDAEDENVDKIPKPHQPEEGKHVEEIERPVIRKKDENRIREGVEEELRGLRKRVDGLTEQLREAKKESEGAKRELTKSKDVFKKALQAEKMERRSEKEELTSAIEERKRAFDELFEEKQVLGQILREEQDTLRELQDRIQHPDLSLWVKQRAERAAILMETPETDAMKFYARKYMAPEVTKMGHRIALLEKRVERSVDHLLPAQYGATVAFLLTIGLIGFPVFVTMSTVVSVTKSVSLRQYVLLGNVFLTAFSSGLCIAGLVLQQDPLQTLYEASERLFVLLQLAAAIAFPFFVGVIACACFKARDREDVFVFGCELVFYVLVGLNYRSRVWRPAMLGQNIETSRMMYVVYVIDFLSMTALTISSAKVDQHRLPSFVVADRFAATEQVGQSNKISGISTNGTVLMNGARSRLGSLGSKVEMAMGGGDGKEE